MSTRKYSLKVIFFFKRKNWKTNWILKGYFDNFVTSNKQI